MASPEAKHPSSMQASKTPSASRRPVRKAPCTVPMSSAVVCSPANPIQRRSPRGSARALQSAAELPGAKAVQQQSDRGSRCHLDKLTAVGSGTFPDGSAKNCLAPSQPAAVLSALTAAADAASSLSRSRSRAAWPQSKMQRTPSPSGTSQGRSGYGKNQARSKTDSGWSTGRPQILQPETLSFQKHRGKRRKTFAIFAQPRCSIASSFRCGNGGEKSMAPALRTPSGTAMMTRWAQCTSPPSVWTRTLRSVESSTISTRRTATLSSSCGSEASPASTGPSGPLMRLRTKAP
mmetsp:Transcript_109586/g.320730  ORF Transcript_109586/g.320730 Transcript_109586/m.320730 type:complete len:291 (+) Transcript_109586:161-1033(+)